jgi:hypothetical protein
MRTSFGKTSKEYVSTTVTYAVAGTLATLMVMMSPGNPGTVSPRTHLATPIPGIHLTAAVGGASIRPDARLPQSITVSAPSIYRVQRDDTLSGIASDHLGAASRWTDLWNANRAQVANPNLIQPGWTLTLPAAGTVSLASTPIVAAPVHQRVVVPTAPQHYPIHHAVTTPHTITVSGYGGFQACVIKRESGGNPQVMNRTWHYGLYQFSYSTWVANGGNPATFGHASVAEQNAVFATAMSKPGGRNNWAPYDGC